MVIEWTLKESVYNTVLSIFKMSFLRNFPCPASLTIYSICIGRTSSNLELIKTEASPIKWSSYFLRQICFFFFSSKNRSMIAMAKKNVWSADTLRTLNTYIIQSIILALWSEFISCPSKMFEVICLVFLLGEIGEVFFNNYAL